MVDRMSLQLEFQDREVILESLEHVRYMMAKFGPGGVDSTKPFSEDFSKRLDELINKLFEWVPDCPRCGPEPVTSDNVSETQIREAVKQAVPDAKELEKRMDKMMNRPSDLVLDSNNVSEDSDGQ